MSEIKTLLADALQGAHTVALLGCGSVLRGDDAAGMAVAERLSGFGGNVRVFCGSNAPENFTGEIKKFRPDTLLVIDAAHMGLPAGEAAIISPEDIEGVSFSTHILPLKVMLDYLRREIGCRVVLVGIQGINYEFQAGMSPEVGDAVDSIVAALGDLLR